MRLIGHIQITMATAETVHREPGFWDKIKRGLGGKVDLDTGEVRVATDVTVNTLPCPNSPRRTLSGGSGTRLNRSPNTPGIP